MQNRKKPNQATDLRQDLIWILSISAVGFLCIIFYEIIASKFEILPVFILAFVLLISAIITIIALVRYKLSDQRQKEVNAFSVEFADYFRYVADINYCVCDKNGYMKLVSAPLQNILKMPFQICNKSLNSICDIPFEDIVSCAKTGSPIQHSFKNDDGVPTIYENNMMTTIGDKQYHLECSLFTSHKTEYYVINFVDITEKVDLKKQIYRDTPIVAFIVIDNLQEFLRYSRVDYKTVVSEVENRLRSWVNEFRGLLREYDKEKYIMLFTKEQLDIEVANKFPILETIRSLDFQSENNGNNPTNPVTISIGIGAVDGKFSEKERAASDALDIALQKGGDQVTVNNGESIIPYGGRVNTTAGSTTVTSRVNSQHLSSLMKTAKNILVMGHTNPDYDSIGACIGLARLAVCAKDFDTENVKIVINRSHGSFRSCLPILGDDSYYRNLFISGDTALSMVTDNTLIVIADVNNVDRVEEPRLLKPTSKVVIVDHHRRNNEAYVFKPEMTYIRPGVAAASELVSEMLELGPYRDSLPRNEANILLAGLTLDTKNFTTSVNTQTFSAMQYLYERGAHANAIKELFTESMNSLHTASDIDSRVRTYRDNIALTWMSVDHPATEQDSILLAKTADKLMTIEGIEAAFALLRADNTVHISARSNTKINVQLIMQRIGGGGHFDMAGAKMEKTTLEAACQQLKNAIDDYLDNK